MSQPNQQEQATPVDSSQAAPANPSIPATHHQLFDYQHMEWELDTPPTDPSHPPYPPGQLFHLYATSGHLFIGVWSPNYEMAVLASPNHMHIVGWSPVVNHYPVQ